MMIKKSKEESKDIELYLLHYRNAPVANLGYSPAQLMSSRSLRSKIYCNYNGLRPIIIKRAKVYKKMSCEKDKQALTYNKTARTKENIFYKNEKVWLQM